MTRRGQRWVVNDLDGNPIYLTDERWQHIKDDINHPEMAAFEEHLKRTIRLGKRQQELLNPRKYRYRLRFDDLPDDFTHLVAIVLMGFDIDEQGKMIANNFVATAYLIHVDM
jgi:hypothetical protein